MLFWAGILTGAFFTWLAVKTGFYETLVLLFNVVISVYISIFMTPVISNYIPGANDVSFYKTFSLAVAAVGTFLILYAISYVFLTGQFKVTFHKIFEILFSGLLGFLTGFLVFSFVALAVTVTPLSRNSFISKAGFNRVSLQANISYMCFWCDLVNKAVASDEKITTQSVIDELLKSARAEQTDDEPAVKDPNAHAKPDDSTKVIDLVDTEAYCIGHIPDAHSA
jgi:signal transduction histidine kinase